MNVIDFPDDGHESRLILITAELADCALLPATAPRNERMADLARQILQMTTPADRD